LVEAENFTVVKQEEKKNIDVIYKAYVTSKKRRKILM